MTILYRYLEDTEEYQFLEVEGKDEMLALLKGWKPVLEDAWACQWFAENVIEGKWEPGEAAIATHPRAAYFYAKYVIKGRFELGEAAIATHPGAACLYALSVIKGRFELGEAVIATHPGVGIPIRQGCYQRQV